MESIPQLPREDYPKIFEIHAVFQPSDGPLVDARISDVSEVTALVEEAKGRLYSVSEHTLKLFEVDNAELLQETYQVPSASGRKAALERLEEEKRKSEKDPSIAQLDKRLSELLYNQWRIEHNFEVEDKENSNLFNFYEPWDLDDLFNLQDHEFKHPYSELPDLKDDEEVES